MKPPSRIKLGGDTIWIVAADPGDLDGQLHPDLRGEYDAMAQTIRYAADHPHPQKLRNTVMHECLHSVFGVTGYYQEWGHEAEELVVQRITPYVLGLWRDNPRLAAFLLEKS